MALQDAINQEFDPWTGTISPDGIWRINGPWFSVANNFMEPSLATLTTTNGNSFLNLTDTPDTNPLRGAEIQTLNEFGYGFYETSMKVSPASGGVASFFLIDFDTPYHEYDIEFLLDHPDQVTFTNFNGQPTTIHNLGFDPSADFHRYGILLEPGKVTDFVDGVAVKTETNPYFAFDGTPDDGVNIAMNTWSGLAAFGGGPPAANSTTVYDWVHFTPLNPEPPPPSTATVPLVTIANDTIMIRRHDHEDLGVHLSTTDSNDSVTLHITGLPRYETITDHLGHTYTGNDITMTMAQGNSGLTLHSHFHFKGHPESTLQFTAIATDPVSHETATSAMHPLVVEIGHSHSLLV